MKNFKNSIDHQMKHNLYLPGLFCTSLASQNRMGGLHLEVKPESRYEPEKKIKI